MKLAAALVSCALCVTAATGGIWLSRSADVDYDPLLAAANDRYAVLDEDGTPTRWYVAGPSATNAASADNATGSGSAQGSQNNTQDNQGAEHGQSETSAGWSVMRIPADSDTAPTSPWKVSVTYSLDGPNVDADDVRNASGLVGIYIDITPATDEAKTSVPVVAFTVPTQVADDISADKGVSLSTQGSDTLIAAAGKPGEGLNFSCYMNAKEFTMSPVAFASLPSEGNDTAATGADVDSGEVSGQNGQPQTNQSDQTGQTADADAAGAAAPQSGEAAQSADAAQLVATATSLVDSLTDAGSGEHQQLIEQLKALRDNERRLDQSVVAERKAAHKQTFDNYMAAYVGSYTTHLSGAIGTSTQLPALMGTAGELSGDTPLAQAVLDLADAVNNVSAAHMHAGAVDALDEVIRRIQQQGTTGLIDDLTTEAAEEATKGSQQYADGQSQLSAAMIPYSMKYTDVYTSNLSLLTGGTSAGASAYTQQAIAETNGSGDLKDAQAKVDAAMATLAAACEHTGKSQALKQIVLRFSDQFEGGAATDTAATDGVTNGATGRRTGGAKDDQAGGQSVADSTGVNAVTGLADSQSQSFYGRTKAADAKRKAQAALKQAEEAKQQQSQDANASLVDDTISMSAGDVMSYANGLTSALGSGKSGDAGQSGAPASSDKSGAGAGESSDAANSAGSAGSSGSDNGQIADQKGAGNDGTGDGSSTTQTTHDDTNDAPVLFGFGKGGTLLTHDMSTLIGETVDLGDAGALITQAATQLGTAVPQTHTDRPRYLLVIPTV